MNNMKQIYLAAMMYSNDWDGWAMPYMTGKSILNTWPYRAYPYLKTNYTTVGAGSYITKEFFFCPSDRAPYNSPFDFIKKFSYGYNNTLGDKSHEIEYPTMLAARPKKLGRIRAGTAILTEIVPPKNGFGRWSQTDNPNAYTQMWFPHGSNGNFANVLYIEGNVESVSRQKASSWTNYPFRVE